MAFSNHLRRADSGQFLAVLNHYAFAPYRLHARYICKLNGLHRQHALSGAISEQRLIAAFSTHLRSINNFGARPPDGQEIG